jgi:nucleotide-binding universal stress UspA family protein
MPTGSPDDDPELATTYRVLVPVSDNEVSAQAQSQFVAGLPHAATAVEVLLTHVLHGTELESPRESLTAQRIGTVIHAKETLRDEGIAVQVIDADDPYPPAKGIVSLAEKHDIDLIVLGGGMHGILENLLDGHVVNSVGRNTERPVAVVVPTPEPTQAGD